MALKSNVKILRHGVIIEYSLITPWSYHIAPVALYPSLVKHRHGGLAEDPVIAPWRYYRVNTVIFELEG